MFEFLEPVRGPEQRFRSMSDEDADLDSIMLLDNLKEDTDEISCIKINNVPLELSLLQAIFEALKTTAKIKHLSLAGVSMKDEVGLVSFKLCTKMKFLFKDFLSKCDQICSKLLFQKKL